MLHYTYIACLVCLKLDLVPRRLPVTGQVLRDNLVTTACTLTPLPPPLPSVSWSPEVLLHLQSRGVKTCVLKKREKITPKICYFATYLRKYTASRLRIFISMEWNPSWEADISWTSYKVLRVLWNLNTHEHIHDSQPLVPILDQINPIHAFPF